MRIVTMIAGPNGSGKTTLTRELANLGIHFGEYLNADDIAASLTGESRDVGAKAQEEVRRRRERALVAGRDHCFETVMSHPSHIDFLLKARAAGFETRIYFVATQHPSINRGRVENRVLHGGHDVPADRIEARYYRCIANLPAAIAAADYVLLFDNSSASEPLRAFAEINKATLRYLGGAQDDPMRIPPWWLSIIHLIKPTFPLTNGPIR